MLFSRRSETRLNLNQNYHRCISTNNMNNQQGLSLLGLVFWVAVLGSVLLLGMKCVPVVAEYKSIKDAVKLAKSAGDAGAIRNSFDANVRAGYIDSVTSRDLTIEAVNGITTVKFAYEKKVPIAGPVSLLFNFTGEEIAR